MRHRLIPHPATSTPFIAVQADLRREADSLFVVYRVTPAAKLKLPAIKASARADGLWRTTCFEAFIRPGAGAAYFELNFSPSTAWAAYRFDGYRQGMENLLMPPPEISSVREGTGFFLSARFDTGALQLTASARVGLSAVLEDDTGAISYWALAHGGDKPDFHRADGLIARLPFESRT